MTTFTSLRQGGTTTVALGKTQSQVFKHEFKATDVIALPQVAGDKVVAFTVPANTYVEFLQAEIVDASMTGTTRIDIGDAAGDTTYVSNASTLTVGTDLTIALVGKFYGSADTIFVKYTTGALTAGNIRLVVRFTDLNRDTIARPKVYTN